MLGQLREESCWVPLVPLDLHSSRKQESPNQLTPRCHYGCLRSNSEGKIGFNLFWTRCGANEALIDAKLMVH